MFNEKEYEQPSPIVRLWKEEELKDDIKSLLQNPYSWISNNSRNLEVEEDTDQTQKNMTF